MLVISAQVTVNTGYREYRLQGIQVTGNTGYILVISA